MTGSHAVGNGRAGSAIRVNLRSVPIAVYLAAALCFFLPFVTVSCAGQRVASFTGAQLVTGTTVMQQQPFGNAKPTRVNPEPLAIAALLSVIVGTALAAARHRHMRAASAILGIVAFVFLLLLKSKIDGDALREGQGVLSLTYGAGFVGATALALIAGCANGVLAAISPFGAARNQGDASAPT